MSHRIQLLPPLRVSNPPVEKDVVRHAIEPQNGTPAGL
jgi:hypothetical protein